MCEYAFNPFLTSSPETVVPVEEAFQQDDIQSFHESIPGYAPSPLVSLQSLATELGVGGIQVKDESHRFGLKAFKGLGASYAIYRFIKRAWEHEFGVSFQSANLYEPDLIQRLRLPVFCTATDGNHGRGVAWFSGLLRHRAVIYMPHNTVNARIENIKKEGAQVVIVDGAYDEAVELAADDAQRNGWQIISDTSYEGYTEIPAWVMAGYTTLFREIDRQTSSDLQFDFIFLQGGVGSLAAAAVRYYLPRSDRGCPRFICLEPVQADCLMASIRSSAGELTRSTGRLDSLMAGLNCGTPSLIAWPILRDSVDLFLAIPDRYALDAMKTYYHPTGTDVRIVSGESGAAGLAALIALMKDRSLDGARERLGIGSSSRVLLFNTEGDTDPDHFQRIVHGSTGPS
jgi:diaminopropionate ammonia-lyase